MHIAPFSLYAPCITYYYSIACWWEQDAERARARDEKIGITATKPRSELREPQATEAGRLGLAKGPHRQL